MYPNYLDILSQNIRFRARLDTGCLAKAKYMNKDLALDIRLVGYTGDRIRTDIRS